MVVAGHLQDHKWPKGANIREVERRVRVPLDTQPADKIELESEPESGDKKMVPKKPKANPYNLEEVISLDFDQLVKSDLDRDIGMMKAKSDQEIEAERWLRWRERRIPFAGVTSTRPSSTRWMTTRNSLVR